jgi:fructokinase
MNVALHLNRFGIKSIVASSVGNDQDGKKLVDFLKRTGLDTRLVQINKKLPTSEAKVILDKDNNATFVIVEPVAWDIYPWILNKKKKPLFYFPLGEANRPRFA